MAVEVAAARRRFTRHEYHRMAEVGILKPTDRVELIQGEIVEMSPPGRRHIAFVDNLNQLLVIRLAGRGIVSVQNPVVLSEDTEPQPDLAIRRLRAVPTRSARPLPKTCSC
jgi:Uma2 family endonuclease